MSKDETIQNKQVKLTQPDTRAKTNPPLVQPENNGSKRKRWSEDEIKTLHDLAGKLPVREIAKKLNRTFNSITQRAKIEGVSLAVETDRLARVDELKRLAGTMPAKDIAKKFGIKIGALRMLASDENISLQCVVKKWTPKEDNFIRKNANLLTAGEMQAVLDRSVNSIYSHANNLGVSLAKRHSAHYQVKGFRNQNSKFNFKDKPLPE